MNEEIQKIIKEQLPAQVGETLQSELEELKRLRELLPTTEKNLKDSKKYTEDLRESINRYKDEIEELNHLKLRKEDLDEQDRNLKIKLLEWKLDCEKEKSAMAIDLNLSLTRNLEHRKKLSEMAFVGQDQSGFDQWASRAVPGSEEEISELS